MKYLFAILLLLCLRACAQSPDSLSPRGRVNDFEAILSAATEDTLAQMIAGHEQRTGNQIAVVTVADFGAQASIDSFGLALANRWGVGQRDRNNGVVVLLSKKQHKARIFTGLGLETTLTDADCAAILQTRMMPAFREQNFDTGVVAGVGAIIDDLEEH